MVCAGPSCFARCLRIRRSRLAHRRLSDVGSVRRIAKWIVLVARSSGILVSIVVSRWTVDAGRRCLRGVFSGETRNAFGGRIGVVVVLASRADRACGASGWAVMPNRTVHTRWWICSVGGSASGTTRTAGRPFFRNTSGCACGTRCRWLGVMVEVPRRARRAFCGLCGRKGAGAASTALSGRVAVHISCAASARGASCLSRRRECTSATVCARRRRICVYVSSTTRAR